MKNVISISLFVVLLGFIISCDLNKSDSGDPNELGGDPNIPLGQVGNTFETGAVRIGNNYYDIDTSIEIVKNDNGVATVRLKADLTQIPAIKNIIDLIPPNVKSDDGVIEADFKFKITSEGIQDDLTLDDMLHTMVKYDAKVGDRYTLNTSNGKTITRTVTEKSTTDDFQYGFMLIKTIMVEQNSRIPGVSKIEYRFNHLFGLVFVELFMEDGTSASVPLFPNNY